MKLVRLDSLFAVKYGSNLELNALVQSADGINFVSRTAKNNGVSAIVEKLPNIEPIQAGVLTVAGGGSVLETFLQTEPFYSGRDLYYLVPKVHMNDAQKLFYAKCINANRYKYSYGRQANKTIKKLQIPALSELPGWIEAVNTTLPSNTNAAAIKKPSPQIDVGKWRSFTYESLFKIRKGKRLTKAQMEIGNTPYIGAVESNNGLSSMIGQAPIHSQNTISLSYNGSVGEAFYQPTDFWATDDVNILYPKFPNTPEIALFICTLMRKEKYRFNYGRKWTMDKMQKSIIKLPVRDDGSPDFNFMENYIKSLPYSSQI